jgi:hypothetical protein
MSNIVLASIPNPKLGDLQILKLFQGLGISSFITKSPIKVWNLDVKNVSHYLFTSSFFLKSSCLLGLGSNPKFF